MQNKTSLRSFKMKNANEVISNNHSVTTSIGDVPIITMSFPSCSAETDCVGSVYISITNSDDPFLYVYVSKPLPLDDSVNINNITRLKFFFSKITFGITYNKQESDIYWEAFKVTQYADKLNDTLISVKNGSLIIPQIKYDKQYGNEYRFFIYSLNDVTVSNLTISFPSCTAENQCVSPAPAYIPSYSDSTTKIYVSKQYLDRLNKNNITQLTFSFSNITFGITYNKKESEGWEVFDVTENAEKLIDTLMSVQFGSLIISQIKYENNQFNIYSLNVEFK
jgi:type VI protein secretion system component Hcp